MSGRTCLALLALTLTSSYAEDVSTGHLRGASKDMPEMPEKPEKPEMPEMPDASKLPDTPGPYSEVPSDADAQKPKPAMQDWRSKVPNATQGSLGSLVSLQNWQDHQFCNVHQTGFFCDGLTRIRCCKLEDGSYAKCGSTANSSTCAAQQEPESPKQKTLFWPPMGYPSYPTYPSSGGSSWVIHRGWHVSSFCRSHHVGSFCSSHHIIHCCNDYGHFVECNSAYSDSGRWC
eukprot:Skav205095  [mRNA]  locus=scaffold2214:110406:111098:+ [translate_table: standard]